MGGGINMSKQNESPYRIWLTFLLLISVMALLNGVLSTPSEAEASPRYRMPDNCLTWDEHKVKYPGIKGEDLVSAMIERCAR